MKKFLSSVSVFAVVGLFTHAACATLLEIDFAIQTDTQDNFQFSVFHSASSNGGQSGNIFDGFTGNFTMLYDTNAGTLEFTDFSGTLDDGGTISLAGSSTLNFGGSESGSGDQLVSGNLFLNIQPDSGNGGTVDFQFDATAFNQLANQFFSDAGSAAGTDSANDLPSAAGSAGSDFGLGLWGMGDSNGVFGDNGQIGIDLWATSFNVQVVPLPAPVALAAVGFGGVLLARRRLLHRLR